MRYIVYSIRFYSTNQNNNSIVQTIHVQFAKRQFLSKRNKEEHIQFVHEKEKKFDCEFCVKRFAKKSEMNSH
jgi:hypothetical protein